MSDSDLLKMQLAGTIEFPPRHQGKAQITVSTIGQKTSSTTVVKVEQGLSHEVTIARSFFVSDIKAIFEPNTDSEGDLENGKWRCSPGKIKSFLNKKRDAGESFQAIIFVREDAPSLLETKAGLTASECVEFYPPVPQRKSAVGHYVLNRTGCLQSEGPSGGPGAAGGP